MNTPNQNILPATCNMPFNGTEYSVNERSVCDAVTSIIQNPEADTLVEVRERPMGLSCTFPCFYRVSLEAPNTEETAEWFLKVSMANGEPVYLLQR